MNYYQRHDLEIQMALAKNIFFLPMVFEKGTEPAFGMSGETFENYQSEEIDLFPETIHSFIEWAETLADPQ